MKINAIILAAGQGTRMRSQGAKVLHTIGGEPMLGHVIDAVSALDIEKLIVVYGHAGDQVRAAFEGHGIEWVHQEQQLGTGHAVKQAMVAIEDDATVLVLYGDTPLILSQTLKSLVEKSTDGLALLTAIPASPDGYGRIIRDDNGAVQAIVEHKDASREQLAITEVNTGIMAVGAKHLRRWLDVIDNNNVQDEYYLTDIIAVAVADGYEVRPYISTDAEEVMGINNRQQQAEAERIYQQRETGRQLRNGVAMARPETVTINGKLQCGMDVTIDQCVVFSGHVAIGDGVHIGPFSVISNSTIGAGTVIQSHCVIEDTVIGPGCRIGPFARVRPETVLADRVHIGNFVEIKKSSIAANTKINHLSYIGDSEIGTGVNIGAGTITCNYDGANKHRTTIEDNVFIGSDTQLVAPVTIGAGATIGAGSTITRDVDAASLALSRVPQKTVNNWKRPVKNS